MCPVLRFVSSKYYGLEFDSELYSDFQFLYCKTSKKSSQSDSLGFGSNMAASTSVRGSYEDIQVACI